MAPAVIGTPAMSASRTARSSPSAPPPKAPRKPSTRTEPSWRPGFVDIHTHYDGQISWDEELAPSSIHGVTTCAMGSCGVGFAPVRPTDHDKLVELMEGVEDIPGTALSEGISWGWESFPEYMDVLDKMPHTQSTSWLMSHTTRFACT